MPKKTTKKKPRKEKPAPIKEYTARQHPVYGEHEGSKTVHMFRGTPMSQALCHGTDIKKFFDATKVRKRPRTGVLMDEVCAECLEAWYRPEEKEEKEAAAEECPSGHS